MPGVARFPGRSGIHCTLVSVIPSGNASCHEDNDMFHIFHISNIYHYVVFSDQHSSLSFDLR